MAERIETGVDEWLPGDPCHVCGSTDTILVNDGLLQWAECNGCGGSDYDDD